jgi:GDP-L-fucose synthase
MTRVLLTGATGFVGRNIAAVLRRHHEVVGVGSADWDLIRYDQCAEMIASINPDVVVHAAGLVGGIGANRDNPGRFMYENLVMGTNIVHTCMTQHVEKFILLSTVCAYPKYTQVPFRESDLWNGYPEETNAPYGVAKKTLMKLVDGYHEQYGFNGINLIPVNMYGPHDHFNLTTSHVIPALIVKVQNAIDEGRDSITLWGSGRASREFLYAADLGDAIQRAISRDVSPEPINIGTGREITIAELITLIAQRMGYEGEIRYDRSKPDGQPRRCLDITRAQQVLGFTAQTELEDGLEETIAWFRKHRPDEDDESEVSVGYRKEGRSGARAP